MFKFTVGEKDSYFFFHLKWTFNGLNENLWSTKVAFVASLNPSTIHWSLSKKRHGNISSFSELYAVQSRRCKFTPYPRIGRLYRFQVNSTATSDGGARKLENNLWQPELESGMSLSWSHDSHPKFASKIRRKANEKRCLKAMQRPSLTGWALIFDSKIFLSDLLL